MLDIHCSGQSHLRKICVVGAGVSGLRAAALLQAAGFAVTILEARDRIGGRIHQNSQLGLPLDMGASWIHGTRDNPFVALAEKTGTTTVACGAVDAICNSNGAWLSRDVACHYYEEAWEILEIAMEKSRKEAALLPDSLKMMDFFRQEIKRRRSKAKQPGIYESLMMRIVEMWGAFMGDDCENQSLKNLWLDGGLEGENLFVASTFRDILKYLSSQLSDKATTLRLGCEVIRITDSRIGTVDVEAADGFRGSFDNVIVTVPLGWLKRNEDVFIPPLAPRLLNAIRSLGYGNLDRVFIKFPSAFWNSSIPEVNGYHDHEPDKPPSPLFPIEALFLHPEYAADTNPAKWRTEIISFSNLAKPFSQPVIMFFIYGQWGRHLTRLVRGMKIDSEEEYYRILDTHFRPYYSKLPNYDPTSSECKPRQFISTDWQNDKFAGFGSFTNQPIGSGDCSEHFEVLRQGMGEDRGIWFAGEHVSPPGGLGTVTGVYWSGEEVARRVSCRYGISQ